MAHFEPTERYRGFTCFERALALGSAEALGLVARYCLTGFVGGKSDKERAAKLAKQGLEMVLSFSQLYNLIGFIFFNPSESTCSLVSRCTRPILCHWIGASI